MAERGWFKVGNEKGQVSIISVMFFMILFSVVVLSFMRIVVSEQRQTENNELAASALASAESGIEDGKRILKYCESKPSDALCVQILNGTLNGSSNCNALTGSALMSTLKNTVKTVGSSKQVVVGDEKNQQFYSCLLIDYLTADYSGTIDPNDGSTIIPLKLADSSGVPLTSAKYFTVAWHNTSAAADGPVGGLDNKTDLLTYSKWNELTSGVNRPAVVRLELVTVPKAGFSVADLTNSARAVTLRPSSGSEIGSMMSTIDGKTVYNLNYWASSQEPNTSNAPIVNIGCTNDDGYACKAWFNMGGNLDLNANNYYLRLQSIYSNTEYSVSGYDSTGSTARFDGVQPAIDVTGRAADSFKRLRSRVVKQLSTEDSSINWWPEYALESGNGICKKLTVRDASGDDACTY